MVTRCADYHLKVEVHTAISNPCRGPDRTRESESGAVFLQLCFCVLIVLDRKTYFGKVISIHLDTLLQPKPSGPAPQRNETQPRIGANEVEVCHSSVSQTSRKFNSEATQQYDSNPTRSRSREGWFWCLSYRPCAPTSKKATDRLFFPFPSVGIVSACVCVCVCVYVWIECGSCVRVGCVSNLERRELRTGM
jgi:hypothetical protein